MEAISVAPNDMSRHGIAIGAVPFAEEGGIANMWKYEWLCQQIVEKAADAIIFADRDGIIRLWNAGAEAIFGYAAEEVLDQNLDLIVPEKLRHRHWEGYHKVMATGKTKYGKETLAVPAITKGENRISIEFTIVLVTDDSGEPLGTAAVIRDVTERFLKQKELKKRLVELEEREKKK